MEGIGRGYRGIMAILLHLWLMGSVNAQEVLPPRVARSTPPPEAQLPAAEVFEETAGLHSKVTGIEKKEGEKHEATDGCATGGFDWTKVPPIHVYPRTAYFPIPPKGPGCYSLWDCFLGQCSKDRPKFGYPAFIGQTVPMFDVDWRYLDDPKTPPKDWLEGLHRVHVGDNWLFNTGGEFRYRHVNEVNSRLVGLTNDYDLTRLRIYGDVWYQDRYRVFVEFLDAQSFNQDLAPLATDINRSDFLNAFLELKVWEGTNGKAYLRGGRQELLYGSQRLVCPPEWTNTRRAFDGVRGYYQTEKWDFDLFWVRPVIQNPSHIDSIDDEQHFAGAWVTYHPEKGQFRDFYYLMLDNNNAIRQLDIDRGPYTVHTLGTRWVGDKNHWLYDVEAMFQFGRRGTQDIIAGAFAGGLGYNWETLPMNPTVWAYYDYASGDQNPNAGDFHTFYALFPFGHYYMGWLDVTGRQNVHTPNGHVYLYPTKWITVNLQYYHWMLASSRDALYNDNGVALRRSATGAAGSHVGDELGWLVNFHLSRRSNLLVGYSHMWAGRFLEQTGSGKDPSLWYVMYNFRW